MREGRALARPDARAASLDRRGFLGLCAAAAASLVMPDMCPAAPRVDFDDNLAVFLADVHAGAGRRCSAMRKHLETAISEILRMRRLPRNVIVFGDVAYTCGIGADYDFSRPLFKLLEDAGIAVTIGMGNHDRRSEYAKRWPDAAAKSLVPGRYVHLVETPHVDFLMLDTLAGADGRAAGDEGPVGGSLSRDEQDFLCAFLRSRTKRVILCAHHPSGDLRVCGRPFADFMRSSPCVAGFVHGHLHRWRREGTNEISLPSAGAWGDVGYALCRAGGGRAVVEPVRRGFAVPTLISSPVMVSSSWQEKEKAFAFAL